MCADSQAMLFLLSAGGTADSLRLLRGHHSDPGLRQVHRFGQNAQETEGTRTQGSHLLTGMMSLLCNDCYADDIIYMM